MTVDGWSARPVWDYSRAASRTTWEIGAIEQNFLGTATQLYLAYRSTPDRGQLTASYYDPDFVVRKAILWASHSSLSNGTSTGFTLGLPFRETKARTALLANGGMSQEQLMVFGPTSTLTNSRGRYEWAALSAGVALHATTHRYARLWLGTNWRA
ncbi:MAG: hypothetical protein Q8Q14_09475, partial [Gemmatimonadales bacterium]|nr:hypothetical protein [Gemmatimonadales bacterium]